MQLNERRNQILSVLHRERFVTVERLCRLLYASPATIRRDLAAMAGQGTISRLHGGAELLGGGSSDMPSQLRLLQERGKKETIAAIALHLLKGAPTVFFDSSSSVYYLARQLGDYSGKHIITNGLATVNYLNEQTNAAVYCAGGRLLNQSSFVGSKTAQIVRSFCADLMFFSCCGFSVEKGCTEAEEENAAVKLAMIESAKKRVLLCDSTKFGKDCFCRTCPTEMIDLIVTDKAPDGKTEQALKGKLIFPEDGCKKYGGCKSGV